MKQIDRTVSTQSGCKLISIVFMQ